jgi:hypothetical protein
MGKESLRLSCVIRCVIRYVIRYVIRCVIRYATSLRRLVGQHPQVKQLFLRPTREALPYSSESAVLKIIHSSAC